MGTHVEKSGDTRRTLVVVTSQDRMGDGGAATGYWLGEVTHFCAELDAAGLSYDLASPRGGRPPLDEKSRAPGDATNRAFLADPVAKGKLERTRRLAEVDGRAYAAIYLAGGHGTMWDFPEDAELARLVAEVDAAGGIVSAVCHGATGLLAARGQDGQPLVAGRRVTGFSNVEETLVGLRRRVPFLLEDALRERGAGFSRALLPFVSHVVEDGRWVTGQNPASAREVGRRVAARLAGASVEKGVAA